MRITSRTKAIAFFITLGVCLVALAIFLNITWIVFHWRQVVPLVLGIIFFGVIIAGLVVNTIFIVREIRRNERQDSFLNAVTHELKTPITSIRLYLETLQSRPLDDAKRSDFYRIMLEDTDRLLGMVDQVLKAGEVRLAGFQHLVHHAQEAIGIFEHDAIKIAALRVVKWPALQSLKIEPNRSNGRFQFVSNSIQETVLTLISPDFPHDENRVHHQACDYHAKKNDSQHQRHD